MKDKKVTEEAKSTMMIGFKEPSECPHCKKWGEERKKLINQRNYFKRLKEMYHDKWYKSHEDALKLNIGLFKKDLIKKIEDIEFDMASDKVIEEIKKLIKGDAV